MAVWLVRVGSHGEHQDKFLSEKRVYVTWDNLDVNLAKLLDREALIAELEKRCPASKPKKLINHASQIWPFAREMQKGDWIVLPLKTQRAIQIGEVTGDYTFEPAGALWWPTSYAAAADGERFLMLQKSPEDPANQRAAKPNVRVVMNWFEEFREKK